MKDVVHAGHGTLRHLRIGQIAFDELRGGHRRQIGAFAGRKVVHDPDTVSARRQLFR